MYIVVPSAAKFKSVISRKMFLRFCMLPTVHYNCMSVGTALSV